jgi:phosphatidylglycerophosphatase A
MALNPRFMLSHPAHWLALGFGSGLSPVAPGTVGTLWAWVSFVAIQPLMNDTRWAWVLGLGLVVGWWACTVTARNLNVADPSAVVWDEVLAFWLILWLITPCGWLFQALAFVLFRYFDAAKPGPVAWADGLFKLKPQGGDAVAETSVHAPPPRPGWAQGLGILLDDLVAALCTLLVLALSLALARAFGAAV